MKDLLDKISSYNIFNYLLPGTLFTFITSEITSFTLVQDDLFTAFFLYYFIGLVISRIGSLIVEPIMKALNLIQYADYANFILASNKDPKIELLLEVSNMYRTISALFVALFLLLLYERVLFLWPHLLENSQYCVLSILLVLFVFSYKKQVRYIYKRVEANTNESN